MAIESINPARRKFSISAQGRAVLENLLSHICEERNRSVWSPGMDQRMYVQSKNHQSCLYSL